ncbi:30S ribosomal protein S20 [Aeoliella sp. ICT_H6.2]|uniref:Small ribosomal subunit protein bS20 n=1 Tax=Aeoliella straminimaris TaxID=2954799 RepID=A0A9X2FFX9_9BACT|nr:30S ribosomal protein S20 [Aeoliella straminimaris]MCO6047543.1 30S ribosomal protein S20 [Aeoliella straminimaris]
MPNSESAKKRLRQNETRNAHNRAVKSNVRTKIRKVRAAVAAGNVEESETAFRDAAKKLDQAAAKRVIHPNAAARTKSRLSKAVKGIKG